MGVNIFTLFAANVIILSVTALAFFAAGRGQPKVSYWQSWTIANGMLALGLVAFMLSPAARDGFLIVLANCFLVLGLGWRWRAARQFGRRSAPLAPILGLMVFFLALFAFPRLFDHRTVYVCANFVLAVLAGAAGYEFWRDRQDGLPSRYGLVLAYALVGLSFSARFGQGMLGSSELDSYLPQDLMLQIHLFVALLHTSATGAFALSIAYERSAIDLRQAALRDPLTGTYNRRAFEMQLESHLANRDEFAIVIFDIDHFKDVNDRFGHAAGDAALRVCVETLIQAFRSKDFVARIGGEEFAVILPDTSAAGALDLSERVRRMVAEQQIDYDGHRFSITLSGGVVHNSSGLGDISALMKAADTGLYRAKHGGRDRVEQIAA